MHAFAVCAQEDFQTAIDAEGENADQFTCLVELINSGVDADAALRCGTSLQDIAAGGGISGCPDGCGVALDVVGSPPFILPSKILK